jgi:hypothetical protein
MRLDKLHLRWMFHPCHWWAYTEKYRVASEFNLAHAPMVGRLPRFLQWFPITMVEASCKVCGMTFWTGWDNHKDVCNKYECFKKHAEVQPDTGNTKEDRRCI